VTWFVLFKNALATAVPTFVPVCAAPVAMGFGGCGGDPVNQDIVASQYCCAIPGGGTGGTEGVGARSGPPPYASDGIPGINPPG
jgi:hypothetical protein